MTNRRRFTYRVEVDAASAQAQASNLRRIFQAELQRVQITPSMTPAGAIQQQTTLVRAQLAQQTAAYRSAMQQQTALHNSALAQQTAAHRAAVQQQAALTRSAGGGGIAGAVTGGLSRFAMGAVAPLAAGFTAQAAISGVVEADRAAASMRRTSIAALQLAGSQEKLTELLRAYEQASGGAVLKADAMLRVTQLQAIGFADNAEELRRFTVAARGASLATGNSIDYIVGQLQLSIANMSTMRLDQLGLGVSEVKTRIEELSDTMPQLTQEARYQEAVLGLLVEKFGGIAESGAGAATGLELVSVALGDLKLEVQQWVADISDLPARRGAIALGGGARGDIDRELSGIAGRGVLGSDLAVRTRSMLASIGTLQGRGVAVPDELIRQVEDIGRTLINTGGTNQQAIAHLEQQISGLERTFSLMSDGGIVLADEHRATAEAAKTATQALIELAGATYLVNIGPDGQIIGTPRGAALQPHGPFLSGDPRWPGSGGVPDVGGFFPGVQAWLGSPGLSGADRQQHALEMQSQVLQEQSAEQRRAADTARQAWERTGREAEQAAQRAATKWESMIRSVPGVFGTSGAPTAEQMEDAKLGIPQNFADNYLRRLEDEVLNKVEHPGVDLGHIAGIAGIDQSLSPEAQVRQIRRAWDDMSLFANPDAMQFLDQAAIQESMARQQRSAEGEANLLAMFGLSAEGDWLPGFGDKLFGQMREQITGPAAMVETNSYGATLMQSVFESWEENASQYNWADAILAAAYADLSAQLEPGAATTP